MPCYKPLKSVLSLLPNGKKVLSFSRSAVGKSFPVPCGRCIGCRLERSRQWAVRILHESKMHDENSFVTLTYDDRYLPDNGTLVVKDVQDWMKRLRERIKPTKIKFFLCGEYGEKLERPHYHAILFGYDFPDKVYFKGSGDLSVYTSSVLSETWPYGFTTIGSVSFDSANYVAGYAVKKINGVQAEAHYKGRKPEFVLMSRGGRQKTGGIGRSFIEKYTSDVFPRDHVIVNGRETRPPRYYFKWLQSRDSKMADKIRIKRENSIDKVESMLLNSGHVVDVAPSRNDRRLSVREKIAEAKLALKKREIESIK